MTENLCGLFFISGVDGPIMWAKIEDGKKMSRDERNFRFSFQSFLVLLLVMKKNMSEWVAVSQKP